MIGFSVRFEVKFPGMSAVPKLRQADVLIGQGKTIPEVCKEIEVSEQTYYRWRQKYGGMSPAMVKELRGLQKQNARLRKVVADQAIENAILKEVAFSIKQHDVIELLRYLFLVRGCPAYLRSDNGSQFIATRVKKFLKDLGVDTLFIEPGSPWENGYVESFNSRMRDELLDGELFLHIDETKYVVERWRMDYNHYRPHSSLGYMTPAGFAELCRQAGCVRPHTPVLEGVQDCGILS